jgi:alkylation response protein AidB-like acyl-CoA dehydrogenase
MAKAFASEAANRACYEAMQIRRLWLYQGFSDRAYARDARITTIYERARSSG